MRYCFHNKNNINNFLASISEKITMSLEKRQSFEERVELNDRLTSKHIRTLLHLQDVHSETEQLKHRVTYLEVCEIKAEKCDLLEKEVENLKSELLKCKDIHDTARESKARLEQMEKDCLAKIDKNNKELTYRHEQEMMRLVSEKLEEANDWAMEKEKLVEKIKQLEKENETLNTKLKDVESRMGETEVSISQFQDSQSTIESYKKVNSELLEAKVALQKGIRELTCENDSLRKSLENLKTKVKIMEVQLRQQERETLTQEVTEPKCEQPNLTLEVKQLKDHILEIEKYIVNLKEENAEKDQVIGSLEFSLQDSSQALKSLYKERDLLKNRIAGLLHEIEELRYQTPQPKQTFSEFVQLKRDMTSLRDEHEKLLKKRGSKPNILPCLTADSKTVARTFSGNSWKSKTSSNS